MLQKLVELSELRCSDPRDRIFAIRGILAIENLPAFQPDYAAPVDILWRELALACINSKSYRVSLYELLDLIATENRVEAHRQGTSLLPSWSLYVGNITPRSLWNLNVANAWRVYRHNGPHNAQRLQFRNSSLSQNHLEMRARIFGAVEALFADSADPKLYFEEATDEEFLWSSLVPRLMSWIVHCLRLVCQQRKQYVHNGFCGIMQNAYFRHSLSEDEYGVSWRTTEPALPPSWEEVRAKAKQAFLSQRHPSMVHDDSIAQTWVDVVPFVTSLAPKLLDAGRCLAFIQGESTGHFAWVCSTTRPGDRVAVVSGYAHPYVLRERFDKSYALQGSAWCDGYTQSEALGIPHQTWQDDFPSVELMGKINDRAQLREINESMAKLAAWEAENIGWLTIR